ncbi:MAG: DUF2330 domain-containing protein [Myxococcales bacterium]|nr:DUF2330 domain-containing protein [Myxococcales bacterium]
MTRQLSARAAATAACLSLAIATLATPDVARACGGFFTAGEDGVETATVDQTGENLIYALNGDSVEVHIQVRYDPNTDATSFAWVVPLLAVPSFSVGSEPLFDNVLSGSAPSYQLESRSVLCEDEGETDTGGSSQVGSSGTGDTGGPVGPEILHRETVGVYDIVVLSDGDAASLMQWLGDNGYEQDPAAEPILAEYLAEGYLFAAFKLTRGVEVDQLHPVVLTYETGEACVPIRLTRIAAAEDLDIRTFFLADTRVAPTNYRHVEINPLAIDWLNLDDIAESYKTVISEAVDEPGAEGHAFVTEYAGPSSVIDTSGIYRETWDASALEGADPATAVDVLMSQAVLSCEPPDTCEFRHPLIEGLLGQFIPVPAGVTPGQFYSCLSCYEALIDDAAWDSVAFAAAYEERVVEPGARARALLDTWPYLTRMYTTISPDEMLVDPIFHPSASLPDFDVTRSATRDFNCDFSSVVTLADGREVYIGPDGRWPTFGGEMPRAQRVATVPAAGAPITLVDNTARINELLEAWNKEAAERGAFDSQSGCGCDVAARPTGALLLGVLGLCLARRRRVGA